VSSHIHIQRELVILNYLGKFYVSLNFYVRVAKNQAVQLKMSDVSTMSKNHKVLVSKETIASTFAGLVSWNWKHNKDALYKE
jgi:hypothetical protein